MKVTHPDVIKAGERDLIDSIKEDLDWDAIKTLLVDKIKKTTFEARKGEIIVHEGEIAFRIDLEVKTAISLLFDREGNFIAHADHHGFREPDEESPASDGALETDPLSESVEYGLEESEVHWNGSREDEDALEPSGDHLDESDFSLMETSEKEDQIGIVDQTEDTGRNDPLKNEEEDFSDSFDSESLLKEFEEDDFLEEFGDELSDLTSPDDHGQSPDHTATTPSIGDSDTVPGNEDRPKPLSTESLTDDETVQDFEEMLSLADEEEEHNSDGEMEDLLKESREFWKKKQE